jgi:predicted helicase
MSIQAIQKYHREVADVYSYSGVNNELSIRRHFANLLSGYCEKFNLKLIDEVSNDSKRPDGTIKNILQEDCGYWESKANVNLEKSIKDKINAGYPLSNTLFQDDKEAILYQNGDICLTSKLTNEEEFDKLLVQFVSFKTKDIKEFENAIEQFKKQLPNILNKLKNLISEQEIEGYNPPFIKAQQDFLEACKDCINPDITISDINEMLLQHILTGQIFTSVFSNANFHTNNNIAKELNTIQETFSDEIQEILEQIKDFYSIIHINAVKIKDYHDKQAFLKMVYENFYKIYNPKAADKMGVVYTPHEIVKFQIESVDYLLEKHFKKTLAHEGVKILDPCVGTGTYICDLIDYLPPHRLEYKYKQDIYCNELGLLPYYIANLNIEYTYRQKMESYFKQKKIKPDNKFNNLCWVDTLDNTGFNFKGSNTELFGLSVENTARIKAQNEQQISVIIGNPPYNANQQNENDNNKNREYKEIDKKIKETYIEKSTAQKTKVYDMYSRFYRWATDRINNEQGIISFITNNSFINAKTFDGFRKCINQDFDFAYIIDTKSDVRANPKIAGTTHNIFGIQAGVALMFLVKKKVENKKPCKIFYITLQDEMLKSEKLSWLSTNKIENIEFDLIIPDKNNNWINQTDNNFDSLIPVCDKDVKLGKSGNAIFKLFSLGVVTNRDEWVYDFDKNNLEEKVKYFINIYNSYKGSDFDNSIKWTRAVKKHFNNGKKYEFDSKLIVDGLHRPFIKKKIYFSNELNEMQYQIPNIFGIRKKYQNTVISLTFHEQLKYPSIQITNYVWDLCYGGRDSQGLPFYIYDKDGNPHENITNWALELFQTHYNNQKITKEQIFNYVYAVLHDPHYRNKYEQNLKREFPRIPFYENFEQWANFGKELIDLHLNYETIEKHPLTRIDSDKAKIPKPKLKADKANGTIQLDDNTRLENVPCEAWEYLLGNRSALEWVLDQYKEKTPKDATIAEKFNTYRFADHKEHVIDLLCRVCKVSVETVRIVSYLDNLSPLK